MSEGHLTERNWGELTSFWMNGDSLLDNPAPTRHPRSYYGAFRRIDSQSALNVRYGYADLSAMHSKRLFIGVKISRSLEKELDNPARGTEGYLRPGNVTASRSLVGERKIRWPLRQRWSSRS
jgi:hypothetical protein